MPECRTDICTHDFPGIAIVEAGPEGDGGPAVGIDRNVGQRALSDGRIIHAPGRRLGFVRRKAKLHARKARRDIRTDMMNRCRQPGRVIASECRTVVLEAPKIGNMTAGVKGTIEGPGRNVKGKSGLGRVVPASCREKPKRCPGYGAGVIPVVPRHAPQSHLRRGTVKESNGKSQSLRPCGRCGFTGNADVNAALNIPTLGTGAAADGGGGVARLVKCEHACLADAVA